MDGMNEGIGEGANVGSFVSPKCEGWKIGCIDRSL